MPHVDELLHSLTPEQFQEWAAFDRLETSSNERLHAQLSAIGGAILYELQVLSYYGAHFVVADASTELKPPKIPRDAQLDPLAWQPEKTQRKPLRAAQAEPDFVGAGFAASMLRAAFGG